MDLILKRRIGNLLNRLGYDVRRVGKGFHVDAFDDQVMLLRGRGVGVILDVGANIGQTAAAYVARFPSAIVHSFEPFEGAYAELAKNVKDQPRVRTHRLAVADTAGSRTFFVAREHSASSLLPTSARGTETVPEAMLGTAAKLEVETTTLDEFCAAEKIESLPILKMDIQGGELMALRGAEGLLRRHAIDLVYTEVLFADLYEGQADFIAVAAHMRERGYALYGLYALNHGSNGLLAWGDAIFVSPRLRANLGRAARDNQPSA